MSITELLEKVGIENVSVQYVDECFLGADYSAKKKGVTLKVFTREVTCSDLLDGKFKNCGMIIWFDRELYPKPTTK